MRRPVASLLALLVLGAVGACSDESRSSAGLPSEPLLAKGGPNAAVCSPQQASDIEKDIKALYGSPAAAANALFDDVQAACSTTDPDAAREELMGYLAFTIQNAVTGQNAFMIEHWGRVFGFVGYTGIDVASTPNVTEAVLTNEGAAAVVDLSVETPVFTGDLAAGITIRAQQAPLSTLSGLRLVTIEKAANNCLGTNLPTFPTCYNFGIFPHESGFNPQLLFALCAVQSTPDFPALAHQPHNEPVKVLTKIDIVCPHPPSSSSASSLVGRVLAGVADLFRPRTLIAGHTGLGGEDLSASPMIPVSRQVLFGNFETAADAPGTPPTATNFPGDDWVKVTKSPGTILVQSALGDLTQQPVVLSQAGGACNKNCGGLELSANIYDEGAGLANAGRYQVQWSSLQSKPSVKEAPFLVLDSSGDVLAKVAYQTVSSQPKIFFNGADANCAWAVNQKQDFVLTVDFSTIPRSVSLNVNGCSPVSAGFLDGNRVGDLARIGWFMTGIDAGIVAFDDVRVIRLPDNAP